MDSKKKNIVQSTETQSKFKTNSLDIKFSQMEIPRLLEIKSYNNEYYNAGQTNRWFQDLLELYWNSSIHASIINNLHLRINAGIKDPLFYKTSLDYLLFGGFCIEVIWNLNHTKILKLNHLDFSKVRSGIVDNETGKVENYIFSNDWFKFNNRNLAKLPVFDTNPNSGDHQIYYYMRYSPQADIYPKPYYHSAVRYIFTQVELNNYYANLIKSNFVGNSIISVHTPMSQDQQDLFEKSIKRQFTGSENAGSVMIMYGESKDNAPEIVKFNQEEDDLKYRFLSDFTTEQISVGHGLPVVLLGVLIPGKLGSSTEIPQFEQIYNTTIVNPMKDEILSGYEYIKQFVDSSQLHESIVTVPVNNPVPPQPTPESVSPAPKYEQSNPTPKIQEVHH